MQMFSSRQIISCLSFLMISFSGGSLTDAAPQVLLEDNFDSYPTGPRATWTEYMPGFGTQRWIIAGLPSAASIPEARVIADASAFGRTGKVFGYTESGYSIVGEDEIGHYPYIYTNLPTAYSGTDSWKLSLDFYADQVSSTAGYWLTALYPNSSRVGAQRLLSVDVRYNTTTETTQLRFLHKGLPGGEGATVVTAFDIDLDTWHHIEITGNNATQQLTLHLQGQDPVSGYYFSDQNIINTIGLGDIASAFTAPSSTVYLDNFKLETIPEPTAIALLGLSALCFTRRRK